MQVGTGCIVRIECELNVSGGELIESSKKSGPVEYRHGSGQMLAGLESRLVGLSAGDEKSGTIPAAEAFGTEESLPTLNIPRDEFPIGAELAVGAEFEAKGAQGAPVQLKVIEVDDKRAVARVVHPLVGKDLEFAVKVLSVRKPPPVPKVEELELDPDE